MTNEEIQAIFNQTFAGLTLFYRDTTLSDELISKYKIGQILMEKGFTDMSYKGGGLAGNLRYLIASAHAKDLSMLNPDMQPFGHVVLMSNSYFKVLDICRIGNKTQVFLLEIPVNTVEFFSKATSNIEEQIVQKAKESFDKKGNAPPLPELQQKEWMERTAFPVGMNDKGEFFYTAS